MKLKNLIIALCLLNLTAKAQTYFTANVGANIGNIVTKINGTTDKAIKPATGYIISGNVNIPLNDMLLFQTGLQFESIHNKVNTNTTSSIGGITVHEIFTAKSHINFINIPAKLFYKMPMSKGSFMFGAGPYLGIGVGGKSQSTDITETTIGTTTTRQQDDYNAKVKFGNNDTSVKRINLGLGVNFCYSLQNNISIGAYSNIGLSNINNQANYSSKTYTYGITVGYVFGRKETK